ncbi:MAG TPA: hypothetical protein VHM66_12315 [Solirubrobacterales bacterium]|nr:hypothetical protein [Solirubrobacterales bacterium]
MATAWYGLLRRSPRRILAAALALILSDGAVALIAVKNDDGLVLALMVETFGVAVVGALLAFRPARSLPPAPRPLHSVLFVNPRSGDGRAARTGLVEAARGRGIETIEMKPGGRFGSAGARCGGAGRRRPGDGRRRRLLADVNGRVLSTTSRSVSTARR